MTASSTAGAGVAMLYHPSHLVPDLDEAEGWLARVFGRTSTRLSTLSSAPPRDGWSNDYATFTPIADVLLDCIDPRRYLVDGHRPYVPVDRPHLHGLGWYADDVAVVHRRMVTAGFSVRDQLGARVDGSDPPTARGSRMPLLFSDPAETGVRHEVLPRTPFPLDHRLAEGWQPGVVAPDDPLGIVRCAHHTTITVRPERARRFLVDVLGGAVVGAGRDDLLGAEVSYVHVADAIVALAVPDTDRADLPPGLGAGLGSSDVDHYASIAWQVVDLDRAEAHLVAEGVRIAARTDHDVLADPTTALGIAWRFTDRPVPGDPR